MAKRLGIPVARFPDITEEQEEQMELPKRFEAVSASPITKLHAPYTGACMDAQEVLSYLSSLEARHKEEMRELVVFTRGQIATAQTDMGPSSDEIVAAFLKSKEGN